MQTYQTVTVVLGIIAILIGVAALFVTSIIMLDSVTTYEEVNGTTDAMVGIAILLIFASIISILISFANPEKHHKKVGVVLLIIGLIGSWLMIIPAIMAFRYKPRIQVATNRSAPTSGVL